MNHTWPERHSMQPITSSKLGNLFEVHASLHSLACCAMKYFFTEPSPNPIIDILIQTCLPLPLPIWVYI